MDWVTATWRYMPDKILKPEFVQQDGKGGVTAETFTEFVTLSKERAEDRLQLKGLDVPDWDAPGAKLSACVAQLVAGYILRKFPAFEALYKDYFANGFAILDEYIADALAALNMFDGVEFVEGPDDFSGFPKL